MTVALRNEVTDPKESITADIFSCLRRGLWRQILGE